MAWIEGKNRAALPSHQALDGVFADPAGDLVVLEFRDDEGCLEGDDNHAWVHVEPDEIFATGKPPSPPAASSADPTLDQLRAVVPDEREGPFSRRELAAIASFPFADEVRQKTYDAPLTARRGLSSGTQGRALNGACRPQRYTAHGKVVVTKRDGKQASQAQEASRGANRAPAS